EAGIALVLGANVGTSVTALLAAIGKPRLALRAAYVHSLFNVLGVVLWLPFLGVLAAWTSALSDDTAREIANAHTIFNVANAFIFLWFTQPLARLAERLAPDRDPTEEERIVAKYLDKGLLGSPGLALDRARLEALRMANRIRTMFDLILPAILSGDDAALLEVEQMDNEVDDLHGHIITYLGEVSKRSLSEDDGEELLDLLSVVNDLEAIGDIIETNLVALGTARIDDSLEVSEETAAMLGEFHALVGEALDDAMLAVTQKNEAAARRVLAMKKAVNRMEHAARAHEAGRLVSERDSRIGLYRLETDVIANLKRIFYFARRVARQAIPTDEQARS
ncbi:MAG: Na/Pi cotransporter family protein, partial [Acidimicrobiia bacterium]|nr:Na/Pi cotransporter family protein [Acidimicrobiia bacterium]